VAIYGGSGAYPGDRGLPAGGGAPKRRALRLCAPARTDRAGMPAGPRQVGYPKNALVRPRGTQRLWGSGSTAAAGLPRNRTWDPNEI